MSVFVPVPGCFGYTCHTICSLGTVMCSALFLLFTIAIVLQGLLCFHMDFSIIFCRYEKNVVCILSESCWISKLFFGSIDSDDTNSTTLEASSIFSCFDYLFFFNVT